MPKNNDLNSISEVYGTILNSLKKQLVSEGKIGLSIPKPNQIGEAPLLAGGPQETGGYMPPKLDKRKMSKKELENNAYNIDRLSDEDEQDEVKNNKGNKIKPKSNRVNPKSIKQKSTPSESKPEKLQESKKITQERLNTFMRQKSIFDKLYENVMNPGPLGGNDMNETDELDALGIEGGDEGETEEGGDEVTFTLDRETAQKLHDVLMSALGGEEEPESDFEDEGNEIEGEGEDEDEDEQGFYDEDEEELGHTNVNAKEPNMGKNNKVGNLKPQTGGASSAYTNKVGADGDHGHALVNAKQPNVGKNNKVGSLKPGKSMFEQ